MVIYRLLSLSPSGAPKSDCRSSSLVDVTAKGLSIGSRDPALDCYKHYNQITERDRRSKRYTRTKGGLTEDEGGVNGGVVRQQVRERRPLDTKQGNVG